MRVRQVPVPDLGHIDGEAWVDQQRRPYVRNGVAYVPVRDGYACEQVLPRRAPYTGRGFYLVGTIAILQGTEPTDAETAAIQAWKNPSGILWIRSYRGAERIPDVRVMAGTSGEVCHRELGISYYLDPAQVMFSQGNRSEKIRMMQVTGEGERVADMFAGIGYFTLPVARAGGRVHAMEKNPVAFRYLEKNIAANRLEDRVTAGCGDCRDLLDGRYDRIIMGHFDAPLMLDHAISHTRPGGTIHLHAAGAHPPLLPEGFPGTLCEAGTMRRIKKVAPHSWHYVLDVRVR